MQALVERFNNVSTHLSFEVVTTFHLKKRIALVRHLILTARRCYEQNNFHGLMAILSSLGYSPYCLPLDLHRVLTLSTQHGCSCAAEEDLEGAAT